MADDSRFKNELEQEAALLQSIKDKLVDQLQRLKVEELALVNYISMSNSSSLSQTVNTTGTYFNNTIQGSTDTPETSDVNETINSMPLSSDLSESLASNSLILTNQPDAEQEEEEDDDEDET